MTTRVRELAEAFDRSFAEPARKIELGGANALAIRVAQASFILPLDAVAFVARAPRIVSLPNGSSSQLGIAGIRGSLVTVFSLATLLGQDGASEPGWIATLAATRGLAIAFDELEGQVTLAAGAAPSNLLDLARLLERVGVGG